MVRQPACMKTTGLWATDMRPVHRFHMIVRFQVGSAKSDLQLFEQIMDATIIRRDTKGHMIGGGRARRGRSIKGSSLSGRHLRMRPGECPVSGFF